MQTLFNARYNNMETLCDIKAFHVRTTSIHENYLVHNNYIKECHHIMLLFKCYSPLVYLIFVIFK